MRPIVRDSAIGESPWGIEGTRIAVLQIQQDVQRSGEAARAAYRGLGLTTEEIAAALAFRFPAIGPPQIEPQLVGLAVRCQCGVRRTTHITPPAYETDACPCGRVWQVQVNLTPVVRPDTEPGSMDGRVS